MLRKAGEFKLIKIPGESFKVFEPYYLPPCPEIDMQILYKKFEQANIAIAELNMATKFVPNHDLFIYTYLKKEALLSSQIEGTNASLNDLLLYENKQKTHSDIIEVEEVSSYIKAMNYSYKKLNEGFPISLRLIKESHKILLNNQRGGKMLPGEFRKSQNWIGGTRPGNALYVPPSVESLNNLLGNLEKFIHDSQLPDLIIAGLFHIQFETIHPFLDGNGRIGRLFIILILLNSKLLDSPVLFLSLYFKENRNLYYELLQEVRVNGNFEVWLEFFLDGIISSSKRSVNSIVKINELFSIDLKKINNIGRAKFNAIRVFEFMKKLPEVNVQIIAKKLKISEPTARLALNHLLNLKIVKEESGNLRDKIYVYRKYLDILEEGTEPFINQCENQK